MHSGPGEKLGRQPAKLFIRPSMGTPWYGTEIVGQRFTAEQICGVMSLGRDPLTVETMTVRRQAQHEEYYWPTTVAPPFFEFEAPVVMRRADGKVKIIAPSGEMKFVRRDGWAGFPDKRNWRAYQ